jgi:hypothetical protein
LSQSASVICAGQSVSLVASAIPGTTYQWANGVSASSVVITPGITGAFSVVASSFGCNENGAVNFTVLPSPQLVLSQNNLSLCAGQSVVYTATAVPGTIFNWSNGATTNSITVFPGLTSVYSVTAFLSGCTNTASGTVSVFPLPQVVASALPVEICKGQTATISLTGTNFSNSLWNNGSTNYSIAVAPIITTVYSATATSQDGCISSVSVNLAVNPLPPVSINASHTLICVGEDVTLNVPGQNQAGYSWNNGQTGATIVVSPSVTTVYSVQVTDNKGCEGAGNIELAVSLCSSLSVWEKNENGLRIYPNPSEHSFLIRSTYATSCQLINELGQLIKQIELTPDKGYLYEVTGIAKGLYIVKSPEGIQKVIVK